ncbi:hypothetical protein ACROYT_G015514 [Oculina patagonica]
MGDMNSKMRNNNTNREEIMRKFGISHHWSNVPTQRDRYVDLEVTRWENGSSEEWNLYVDHIGPQAVKRIKEKVELDLKQSWKSKANSLPELYKLVSCYCTTTIGSYDVERSFSAYNAILGGKLRSLEQNTMKAFHFLNWNLRVKFTVQEEQDIQEARNALPQDKSRKRSFQTSKT